MGRAVTAARRIAGGKGNDAGAAAPAHLDSNVLLAEDFDVADRGLAGPSAAAVAATAAAVVKVDENLLYVAKKWKVVGTWKWNFATDTCAICRNRCADELSVEVQGLTR